MYCTKHSLTVCHNSWVSMPIEVAQFYTGVIVCSNWHCGVCIVSLLQLVDDMQCYTVAHQQTVTVLLNGLGASQGLQPQPLSPHFDSGLLTYHSML